MNPFYKDIAQRTGGDIYIGVVGPCRTGKSTFIKRFMEQLVIPEIGDPYRQERARDELPQSGSGRTIMTAEPKFVPEEAAELALDGGGSCRVRLIDCVGYLIDGALGTTEDGEPRMVTTPWFDQPIPMREAAEEGTHKVIAEHSTIGLVITTDGSIADFPREAYIPAETRVIQELQTIGKPFLVALNSTHPNAPETRALAEALSEKYGVPCHALNCLTLDEPAITALLQAVLYEFPVRELGITLPDWVSALDASHPVMQSLYDTLREAAQNLQTMRQIPAMLESLAGSSYIEGAQMESMALGEGTARAQLSMPRALFYQLIQDACGLEIDGDGALLPMLRELSEAKREYDRISAALAQARATGYGIVMPGTDELALDSPEIIQQGGRYGVRLCAKAPSIHLIRAEMETEIAPIVGTESQSRELADSLRGELDGDDGQVWQSNLFGKSLEELVSEGLQGKLARFPAETQGKLQETLEKIVNEGANGLICLVV